MEVTERKLLTYPPNIGDPLCQTSDNTDNSCMIKKDLNINKLNVMLGYSAGNVVVFFYFKKQHPWNSFVRGLLITRLTARAHK